MEAKVPGIAQTEKVQKETGKENKGYYKDVEKKMAGYEKDTTKGGKDKIEPVMTNYTDDWAKEYHEDMEIMNGQEMLHYQNNPDKKFVERATMSIEGDAMMGNSPKWANIVEKGQGGDPDYGKTLVARIKSSQKKRQDATSALDQFGDDIEEKNVGVAGTKSAIKPSAAGKKVAVESKIEKKGTIMESKKIKRLTFKNEIGGLNNAKAIIPESYKVDKKVFEVTDGNENYRFRWEGDKTGEAVALKSSVKTAVNEDMEHMKHLMGFKSDLGRLNPVERLNENEQFKSLFKKVVTETSARGHNGMEPFMEINTDGTFTDAFNESAVNELSPQAYDAAATAGANRGDSRGTDIETTAKGLKYRDLIGKDVVFKTSGIDENPTAGKIKQVKEYRGQTGEPDSVVVLVDTAETEGERGGVLLQYDGQGHIRVLGMNSKESLEVNRGFANIIAHIAKIEFKTTISPNELQQFNYKKPEETKYAEWK